MSIAVCTIIAKNYLALAKTLGNSLHVFHPLVDFHILVIDPFESPVEQLKLGKMMLDSPMDFIEAGKYKSLAYEYDITELSTAVKPFYLEHLFLQGYDKVLYFDPDILILQPIDQIFQALDTNNIVLIPHILDPIALDGCIPSEITLLQAGAYNLGFIGISKTSETGQFLNWWKERLEKYCLVAPAEGLFVDQKWIDLVPGMFQKVQILTARGYDVAYWNLNARHLSERDGVYWVDDELLVFFHFSGFNADRPNQLSKYQNRIKVEALPTLAKLLQHYACLLKENGHDEYRYLPYSYSTFSNGVTVDNVARSLLREAQKSGLLFPNPNDVAAEPCFFKWLNSPVTEGNEQGIDRRVTNYLLGLYKRRLDLQIAFPNVLGVHQEAYLAWADKDAINQGVHEAYVRASYADNSSNVLLSSKLPSGVNVAGYLTAESGTGEAARGYVAALKSLKQVEIALTDFTVGVLNRKEDSTFSEFVAGNPYPINLVCINADQVPIFMNHVGSSYFEQKHNIGVWWWEVPDFPEQWRDRFAHFDQIWVGSVFAYQAVSRHSPVPVFKMPPVVSMHLTRTYPKDYFGLAESEFIFLFVFDFLSVFERKNPLAVVEAFKIAFQPDEPVRLVLKCINGEHDPDNFNRLKNAIGDTSVTIMEHYLSKDEKNGLISACDCYVSLHRSEGFGLTLAEAMLLEKPAIATGWSGNIDFMTVNNSYLVEYELVSISTDYGPYKQGQIWANPSIQHAAQLMRGVYEQPEEAQKKAKRAAADIQSMHSPAAVAEIVQARLEVIQSLLSKSVKDNTNNLVQETPLPPVAPTSVPTSLSHEIMNNSWATESRFGKLGLLAKKVMERLIRFYVNHQDVINHNLFSSNQAIREYIEQQQTLVTQLERQIVSLRERVEGLQIKTREQEEALNHNLNQQLLASDQAVRKQTEQQTLVDQLRRQIISFKEHVSAIQIEARQAVETLERNFNQQLLASIQSVQEQAEQQQVLVDHLEQQVASLGERDAAIQTETQQAIEVLELNLNQRLLASDQVTGERVEQQQALVNQLEKQIASLEEHIAAIPSEAQQAIEALEHKLNQQLLALNQAIGERAEQQAVSYLEGQVASFKENVAVIQSEAQQAIKALEYSFNERLLTLNQAIGAQAEQQTLVSQLEGQVVSFREHVAAIQTETRTEVSGLLQKLDDLSMRFAIRPYMQIPVFSFSDYGKQRALGYESSSLIPHEQFDYLGFEEIFRGSESFIKERQSVYLRFFTNRNLVLDIGCGRGEFLELLAEGGIQAIGVDTNSDMARRCAEKGLTNVVLQDCNEYLISSQENNVDGIFSAQFLEHLPFEKLYKFLTLSRERLSPGGIFVSETVNPHAIEAMKTFYVDLTHIKPLFPEVMLFLCRSAGFSKAEIFYPNGLGFSEEQYWLQGEYAVVAWK